MMRPLLAAELLDVWDRGTSQPAPLRALLLLAAACPEEPYASLTSLSIGQRDGRLLTLREWTFGSHIEGLATCPACGERLEVTFNTSEVRVPQGQLTPPGEALEVEASGWRLRCRLPDSQDLLALMDYQDRPEQAKILLLHRCLLGAELHGQAQADVKMDDLPVEAIAAVMQAMSQADPQAEVLFDLTCPACKHAWQEVFDILSFFWAETQVWALRTLREVAALARVYGWREADILSLSPLRRQLYLEMARV